MKKRSLLILSTIIIIATVSAFGITKESANSSEIESQPQTDSTIIDLADFGISGGINIDIRTGKKIEFTASNKKQNLFYLVRGYSNQKFLRPITRKKLSEAISLSDVIENYPTSWIKNYNSVTVLATINGKEIEAIGKNATLTKEQKELFNTASEVFISVQYQKENYNDQVQNRVMNVSLVATPENSAEFKGGYDKMIAYLRDHSLGKIQTKDLNYMLQSSISFIINEQGNIENVAVDNSSKDSEIDELLIDMIKNMPQWIPAKNMKDENVKQKFVLDIGLDGC